MRYYKITENGYIPVIGTGHDGTEISKEEYDEIRSVIENTPEAPEGYACWLKEDLTWELKETAVIPDEEEEISDSEALGIILGGERA